MHITGTLLRLTGTLALALSFQAMAVGNAWAAPHQLQFAETSDFQLQQTIVNGLRNYEPPDNGRPDSSDSSGTM